MLKVRVITSEELRLSYTEGTVSAYELLCAELGNKAADRKVLNDDVMR